MNQTPDVKLPDLNDTAELVFSASSCLMQDALPSDAVSVRGHGLNTIAVYKNPFLHGQTEALVIDVEGKLTHLRRASEEMGWEQQELDIGGAPILASEVVTVVNPRDLAILAFVVRSDGSACQLRLEPDQGGRWAGSNYEGSIQEARHLYVYYSPRTLSVVICGIRSQGVFQLVVGRGSANIPVVPSIQPVTFTAEVKQFACGRLNGVAPFYVLMGEELTYISRGQNNTVVSSNATQLLGVFEASGAIGCLYEDTAGNLCTFLWPSGHMYRHSTAGPGLVMARSWLDAYGMLHVFGVDREGALQVLHQSRWSSTGMPMDLYPMWSTSKTEDNAQVLACVGVQREVAGFVLDPFPDALPTQLLKQAGVPANRQYKICTQDMTTDRWTSEKVRLRAEAHEHPEYVSHYVSDILLTNAGGTPMPEQRVGVTADSLVEILSGGATYLVGPGQQAALTTNALGRLTIAMDADSFFPPTLQVSAIGAGGGLSIQAAADVHTYLGGEGSLPSQKLKFSAEAMLDARVDGQPITNRKPIEVEDTVKSVKATFALAKKGKNLKSQLGSSELIHGFSLGESSSGQVRYVEFGGAQEHAAHLDAVRAHPQYGGIWDDFKNFAADVWQGIKSGAIRVRNVAMEAATSVANVFIYIKGKIVELAGFIVDTVEKVVHIAQACLRQVVDSVQKAVEWLQALFAFKDIWETKKALEAGFNQIFGYGVHLFNEVSHVSHDWFKEQEGRVKDLFKMLKENTTSTHLGDYENKAPGIKIPQGNVVSASNLKSHPQANWMLNQAMAVGPGPQLALSSGLSDIFEIVQGLVDAFERSEAAGELKKSGEELVRLATLLFDPGNPNGVHGSSLEALLGVVEHLALALLKGGDALVQGVLGFIRSLLDKAREVLRTPLSGFPRLQAVWDWIQVEAGVPPETMTLGGVCFLIAGFFATTTFKLIKGVDQAPFPGGVFPALPAPPSHPDHDPTLRADPALNQRLADLQIACGACGLLAAFAQAAGDVWPRDLNDALFWPEVLVATVGLVCSNVMLGVVMWCPPVTGMSWDSVVWTLAFVSGAVVMAVKGGVLAAALAQRARPSIIAVAPFLKNSGDWGPGLDTVMSTFMAIVVGCTQTKGSDGKWHFLNSYSIAANVLGFMPGVLQFFRISAHQPSYVVRAGLVAGVDGLCLGTVGSMIIASAAWPGPEVTTTALPEATIGQPYSFKVDARGGDQPFNKPLNWATVEQGSLPAGLSWRTDDTGDAWIEGTPSATAETTEVTLRCYDSFGPPKYSEPKTLKVKVNKA
jgi:hypothetical protein